MKGFATLCTLLLTGLLSSPASAGYVVSATQTSILDVNGIDYDYSITLTNSSASTQNVGTFWYAWLPGENFMVNSPISETQPAGWSAKVTNLGAADGYGILWVAGNSGLYLTPGGSLHFGFESAETPDQLAGFSPFYPTTPETTSFVYNAAPYSDPGTALVVTPGLSTVPEPSSLALMLIGGIATLLRGRIGRSSRAG